MVFENSWIKCFEPDKKGLFPGTKVHFTECIACSISDCTAKGYIFAYCFPADVDPDNAPLNKKVMGLNEVLKKKKKSRSQLYCPKRKNATTKCTAKNSFCKYNIICERNANIKEEGFIKSIRWRKAMIYVVRYLDGTSAVVDRSDFTAVDIDKVEKVFSANYEVKIVSELVPQGEESTKLAETVSAFKEKYNGNVVTHDGMVDFEEWFENSSNGDSAVIPEKILVPQKTYKVVRIKSLPKISPKKGIKEVEKEVKPEKEKNVTENKEKVNEKKQTSDVAVKPTMKSKGKSFDENQPSLFENENKEKDTFPEDEKVEKVKKSRKKSVKDKKSK